MPGLITRELKVYNAKQFKEAVEETDSSKLYAFFGRILSWANNSSPPTPDASVANVAYSFWRSMLGAKKITASNISLAVKRYNWANNVVYREWNDQDPNLYSDPVSSNTFYVVTTDMNVYKCLFNNKGASSTVMPTGQSTSVLVTGDNYHWKFMYNLSSAENLKFVTTRYIPVKTITADDGSSQWLVQQAASNGAINAIDVVTGGNSYLTTSNTFSSVTDSRNLVLANNASAVADIYVNSSLYISSGLGSGQIRKIVNYVGSTKTITVNNAFTPAPNTSSTYIISPSVTITGDGSGAVAWANVSSGAINYVNMISTGSNYSRATVTITANSIVGSGATARAYLPPLGGHGSDPTTELSGEYVIISSQFIGSESNTFTTSNDFHVFGLIADPKLRANGAVATGSIYDQTTKLTLTGVTNSAIFTADELVSGATSSATARVVEFANTNSSNTAGTLKLVDVNGTFQTSESLSANTSGVSASVNAITNGTLKEYTGKLLYIENISPITRGTSQIEDVKIIVEF